MKYFVEIVEFETDEVVRRIPCGASERKADQIDLGANINLNHDRFFTRIVTDDWTPEEILAREG